MNQEENDGGEEPKGETQVPSEAAAKDTQPTSPSISTETTVRNAIGQGMNVFSEAVNNNLIAARYATFATVSLLAAYGISNTPLFFRYKNVAEIPAQVFLGRKRLRARLIKTQDNDQAGQPIVCYVRHLSPVGQFLSRDLFEFGMKAAPSAQVSGKPDSDLIKVEIAGLSAPPFYASTDYQRGEWLRLLANDKTKVTLQLLGRRVMKNDNSHKSTSSPSSSKRDVTVILPELENITDVSNKHREEEQEQIAVGRLYYRPSLFQLFATDLAVLLVRYGHACVESELYMKSHHTQDSQIVDASQSLDTIRKDVDYLDRLGKLEYEAAKESYGMWSDTMIRDKRRDIVDEVEFQTTATVWQRVWRWLRG